MDTFTQLLRLLLILIFAFISGCAPQTPIPVYWTATPQSTYTPVVQPTVESVVEVTAQVSQPTVIPPTEIVVLPSPTAVQPTAELATTTIEQPSLIAPLANPLTPEATWQGPVTAGERPTTTLPVPTIAPAGAEVVGVPASPSPAVPQPTLTPTTGAPAPVMPTLDPNRIGVQLDINLSQDDWNAAMGALERLGVKWIKVQLPWRDMQPAGPGTKSDEFFLRTEQYLEDASNRGFNVLVSIVKAPPWARSNQAEDGPPDDPQHLADFITLMFQEINADLYRPVAGEYIDAVEIWNEPNLLREWQGTLPFSGAGYMRLFDAGYQAVRAYSPDIPVITAGLAPTSTSPYSVDDREFLRQMFAAGLGGYSNVMIGVHPYGWANPPDATCCNAVEGQGWDDDPHFFFADTLNEYRQILRDYGFAGQMWITEFGYASWDGFPTAVPAGDEWMTYTDKMEQGLYTMRALELIQASPDLGVTSLWNLNFATLTGLIQNSDERVAYSMIVPGTLGVIDPNSSDRTERPIYWMLYDAVRPDVQLSSF
jgi:hypothetical protein